MPAIINTTRDFNLRHTLEKVIKHPHLWSSEKVSGTMHGYDLANPRWGRDMRHVMRQVVSGLAYLHAHGIAHRDITLANVFRASGTQTYRLVNNATCEFFVPGELSQSTAGSLANMAPEVLRGAAHDPAKADIWSLGKLLCERTIGWIRAAESADDRQAYIDAAAHMYVETTRLQALLMLSPLQADLYETILRMTHPDPQQRWTLKQVMQCAYLNRNMPIMAGWNQSLSVGCLLPEALIAKLVSHQKDPAVCAPLLQKPATSNATDEVVVNIDSDFGSDSDHDILNSAITLPLAELDVSQARDSAVHLPSDFKAVLPSSPLAAKETMIDNETDIPCVTASSAHDVLPHFTESLSTASYTAASRESVLHLFTEHTEPLTQSHALPDQHLADDDDNDQLGDPHYLMTFLSRATSMELSSAVDSRPDSSIQPNHTSLAENPPDRLIPTITSFPATSAALATCDPRHPAREHHSMESATMISWLTSANGHTKSRSIRVAADWHDFLAWQDAQATTLDMASSPPPTRTRHRAKPASSDSLEFDTRQASSLAAPMSHRRVWVKQLLGQFATLFMFMVWCMRPDPRMPSDLVHTMHFPFIEKPSPLVPYRDGTASAGRLSGMMRPWHASSPPHILRTVYDPSPALPKRCPSCADRPPIWVESEDQGVGRDRGTFSLNIPAIE